jgi:DNA processing protein
VILPIYILAITNIPKVGRKTAIKLIREFDRALETEEDFFLFVEFVESKHPGKTKEWDAGKALESANLCLENSSLHGISITTYWDTDYPELLKTTDDPPIMLHHKGNLKCLNEKATVALVGTRKPTAHGYKCATKLGKLFAESQLCVVSGLAIGCDTAAHSGCLSSDGIAAAVLACSLDNITSKSSISLSEEILNKDGTLISEYPVGTKPHRGFFVERDRIQAGISRAVVVVETAIDGGTMHAVKHAQASGRIIACVDTHPDSLTDSPSVLGNKFLINEKNAHGLKSNEDIAALINSIKAPPAAIISNQSEQAEFNLS